MEKRAESKISALFCPLKNKKALQIIQTDESEYSHIKKRLN